MKITTAAFIFGSTSVLLAGCAAPLVVGMAGVGGYVVLQERNAKQTLIDTSITTHIKERLTSANFKFFSDIKIDVFYNDVLLTGIVENREIGEQVLQIVKETPEVGKIYNELFVGGKYTAKLKAKDAWITAQIQPRLLTNRHAFPINYQISVVNGHVYAMGVARSPEEHEHMLHVLRTTKGVDMVHDYVSVEEEKVRPLPNVTETKPAPINPL